MQAIKSLHSDVEEIETGEFQMLTGTPEELGHALGNERKVFAVVSADDEAFEAFIKLFEMLAPSLNRLIEERHQEQEKVFEGIFNLLLPPLAPTPEMMIEAEMKLAARQAVMNGGDWLPAAKTSALAGFSGTNSSTHPNRWKKAGQIFAINYKGNDFFPFYALDPSQGFKPAKALKPILEVLRETKDDWEIALWFASANSGLNDERPQDLLLSSPDMVLDAARDEVVGIVHG